tara:strand:- start:1443 stop:1586 length:144 start_codon:yes stop_codon:yes gene_type:complete
MNETIPWGDMVLSRCFHLCDDGALQDHVARAFAREIFNAAAGWGALL